MVQIERPQEGSKAGNKKFLSIIGWLACAFILLAVFLTSSLIYRDQLGIKNEILNLKKTIEKNAAEFEVLMTQSEQTGSQNQQLAMQVKKMNVGFFKKIGEIKKINFALERQNKGLSKRIKEVEVRLKEVEAQLKEVIYGQEKEEEAPERTTYNF